jgi:dethiobiotin synthetase
VIPRPERLVLVVGTGTEVGKTWVACRLARALRRRGLIVAARKPAQSFALGDDPADTDAALLAHATGDHPAAVCPRHRWYPLAMAPPMAAEALGRPPFSVGDLAAELRWGQLADVGAVESAGGVRSPLADDGDTVDLAALIQPDLVVLVADAGLGTINEVRLSITALAGLATVVHLNRYRQADDVHRRNHAWLSGRDGFAVTRSLDELVRCVGQGRALRSGRGML